MSYGNTQNPQDTKNTIARRICSKICLKAQRPNVLWNNVSHYILPPQVEKPGLNQAKKRRQLPYQQFIWETMHFNRMECCSVCSFTKKFQFYYNVPVFKDFSSIGRITFYNIHHRCSQSIYIFSQKCFRVVLPSGISIKIAGYFVCHLMIRSIREPAMY